MKRELLSGQIGLQFFLKLPEGKNMPTGWLLLSAPRFFEAENDGEENGAAPREEFRLSNKMGRVEVRTSPVGAQVVFDGHVAYLERAKPEDVGLSSAYVDSFLKEVVKDTAIRANRIRLDGALAVTGGLKVAGNLEMKAGSSLRVPDDPELAQVKSISFRGEGPVVLRPNELPKRGQFRKLLRIEEMPEDLSRFRLAASQESGEASFKPATGGKFLGVTAFK